MSDVFPPSFSPPPPTSAPYSVQAPPKDFVVAVLLSSFLGIFAVDRFYLGYTALGIAKLAVSICTCFVGGIIWQLVDFYLLLSGNMPDAYGRPLQFRTKNVKTV